jgi:hypothetical protein
VSSGNNERGAGNISNCLKTLANTAGESGFSRSERAGENYQVSGFQNTGKFASKLVHVFCG